MVAFEHAVSLGYRYLETDVHVTADGVVVAFHDDHLDRATDRAGRIADLPWSEVSAAQVDGREPIPLLEDLLGTFPEARVNIDPKHDAVGRAARRRCCSAATPSTASASAPSPTAASVACRALCGPGLCTSMGPKQVARLVAGSRGLPGLGGSARPARRSPPGRAASRS